MGAADRVTYARTEYPSKRRLFTRDYTTTEVEARKDFEVKREARLASLKKQIKKLTAQQFKLVDETGDAL